MVENCNGQKIVCSYHTKELQYTRKTVFRTEEVIKKKRNTCMLN